MSSRARRSIFTLCVAAAAFVAGYLLGRSGGDESGPPADPRRADAASSAGAKAPRPVERSPLHARRRAGPEPEPTFREPLRADGPGDGSAEEPPAATVRLRIRSRDGATVPGIRVSVTATGGPYLDWEMLPSRVTDADGSIAIDIPKLVLADYTGIDVRVTADGFAPREIRVPLSSVVGRSGDARGAIDVGLDHTVEVRGRCVDRARKAIAGVNVLGPRGVATTFTDVEGRFRLTGVAEPGGYVRFFPGQLPLAAVRVDLSSSSHGVVDLGDVLLDSGETLRGRFLDAAGNPIAGAHAILVSRELEGVLVGAAVTTDAEGRFTFEHVGLGTFDVGLSRPGYDLDGGDLTNIAYGVRATEEVIVRATRDHYVGVQFVDEDKAMVKFRGGRVTWFALDDPSDRLDWWGIDGGWDHFHIAARPGATYEVRIELDGYEELILRATATEARDTHVDAVLRRKSP
jgi:hypothetical protein